MRTLTLTLCLLITACANSGDPPKPTGTPTDPVETCERITDVCRLDGAKLGVCVKSEASPPPPSCEGKTPCLVCMSQH
jgi:hypothetical protein